MSVVSVMWEKGAGGDRHTKRVIRQSDKLLSDAILLIFFLRIYCDIFKLKIKDYVYIYLLTPWSRDLLEKLTSKRCS
jgi:hypothetical protein